MPPVQNIYGRSHISLDGRWSYIIDPYENGYYDYRHMPFDQSASGKGGFYDDRKPKDKTDWVEYDFDRAPTMKVPGDWNSQAEKLQLYEGTVWLRQVFQADPKLTGINTFFRPTVPQFRVEVNREQALSLGVPPIDGRVTA